MKSYKEDIIWIFYGIVTIVALLIGLSDIYIHIKYWINWQSFFITLGLWCLSSLTAFGCGWIFFYLLYENYRAFRMHHEVEWTLKAFPITEAVLSGWLSIALWYYSSYHGLSNFWLIWVPIISIGLPFLMNIVFLLSFIRASNKEEMLASSIVDSWKKKWDSFTLGDKEAERFQYTLEEIRRKINLKYSTSNCMRLLAPDQIEFMYVDDFLSGLCVHRKEKISLFAVLFKAWLKDGYFEEIDRSKWCFDADRPMHSFGGFATEFKSNGYSVLVAIKISVTGECLLVMDGKRVKYSENEFNSIDEMLKFLDKKIGIES
jgi:hypothetical protein